MEEKQLEQVVKDEERLRELKRQNRQKRRQNVQQSQSSEQEVTRTIQKGTIRDYERSQDTGTYTLRIETKHDQVDVIIPMATEYTLDEELVTLLEWKDIDDGRVGDLLDEQVYVNTDTNEILLPNTMSPISRGITHIKPIYHRLVSMFDVELYFLFILLSLLTSIPMPSLIGLEGPIIVLFTLIWTLFLGPMIKFAFVPVFSKIYNTLSQKWVERYHKL